MDKNLRQAKEIQLLKVDLASKRTQFTETNSFSNDARQQIELLQDQMEAKHKQYLLCKQQIQEQIGIYENYKAKVKSFI